eukprot:231170-Alexandrium_andersonii.AAC.1
MSTLGRCRRSPSTSQSRSLTPCSTRSVRRSRAGRCGRLLPPSRPLRAGPTLRRLTASAPFRE